MNVVKIETILKGLGARETRVKGNKVTTNCLLAPWTHSKGRDMKPSMVILEGRHGDPIYSCRACHRKGTLRDLLCFIWVNTKISTMRYIEVLDGDVEKVPKGVNPEFRSQKQRVLRVTKTNIDKALVEARVAAHGDGKAWHDKEALRQAEKVSEIPWYYYEPFLGSVPRYAIDRGITIDTCKAWELGHDKRMRRLLFPMRDRNGRLVAISGRRYACQWCGSLRIVKENRCTECRRLEPDGVEICSKCSEPTGNEERCAGCKRPMPPKYLHNDGFKRNLHLYGENRVEDGDGLVYVVEGHFDALMLWQWGYRPVVALLGSHPGGAQIEKLVAYYERVLVVPDGDDAGDKMVVDLKGMIAWRIPVMSRHPKRGKDPCSLGRDGCLDLLGPPPVKVAA